MKKIKTDMTILKVLATLAIGAAFLSSATASAAPVSSNDRGTMLLERAYDGTASTAGLGFAHDVNGIGFAYGSSLADWQAFLPNAAIMGFSPGAGNGWSSVRGGADTISSNIDGEQAASNFEVRAEITAVPEPMTLALFGLGIVGVGVARIRHKS